MVCASSSPQPLYPPVCLALSDAQTCSLAHGGKRVRFDLIGVSFSQPRQHVVNSGNWKNVWCEVWASYDFGAHFVRFALISPIHFYDIFLVRYHVYIQGGRGGELTPGDSRRGANATTTSRARRVHPRAIHGKRCPFHQSDLVASLQFIR